MGKTLNKILEGVVGVLHPVGVSGIHQRVTSGQETLLSPHFSCLGSLHLV